MRHEHSFITVGTSQRKVDALGMAAGVAQYVDDIVIPGLLHPKFL